IILVLCCVPAFMALACDERLAGFALCLERIKGLLQPFFGGFPGVYGTSHAGLKDGCYRFPSFFCNCFNPKKAGPDQRVPVICRAIWERLLYRCPRYSNPPVSATTSWVWLCHCRISLVPGLIG